MQKMKLIAQLTAMALLASWQDAAYEAAIQTWIAEMDVKVNMDILND